MYGIRSALFKYSVTTFEPGARLVFTQGFTCNPRRTALRASSPAAISTDGEEGLVQLVMAALADAPDRRASARRRRDRTPPRSNTRRPAACRRARAPAPCNRLLPGP